MQRSIRNFVIIAHVDHGKSTLADRLLEVTGTVPERRMRAQYLDQLDLERERGITIKMAPVRMNYKLEGVEYMLNLIDTPGHSDFSYEVSRALNAVEGAILLVDVTKGIQAQTLSNFRQAKKSGLTIVGAVNKIDLGLANVPKVIKALSELLGVEESEIFKISGKTGDGVRELLDEVIRKVPPPHVFEGVRAGISRALTFDSLYDDHKGILAHVRVAEGEFKVGDEVHLLATNSIAKIKEVGSFAPKPTPGTVLKAGEIGYIATGFKEPATVKIGDTIAHIDEQIVSATGDRTPVQLPGYRDITPVVFISFYPDGATEFDDLKKGFERLRLTDAALSFEPDSNEALGRGLKVGFLGQLHFEITAERLTREFKLEFMTSFPSIAYRVRVNGELVVIKDAHEFPDDPEYVLQPMIKVEVLSPSQYLNSIVMIAQNFDLIINEVVTMGDSTLAVGVMPLAELIRDFDDQLKSTTAGYASFSYELVEEAPADVEKLEILVANEVASALTRIVPRKDLDREARTTVERLKNILPAQQFAQALQARSHGKFIARETIAAAKKDVTQHMYGGDRTRKMKLWKKQARGKERLNATGRVHVPLEVFREILKK